MFAQAMIVHHKQEILISKMALKQGSNPVLKKIARRIINEQAPEIAQLLRWLPVHGMAGMAGMSMQGLLSQKELEQLKAARGKRFDGLYLVDITLHHQGAIAMATPLLNSKNLEVATLCKSIVATQRVEVVEFRRIMKKGK